MLIYRLWASCGRPEYPTANWMRRWHLTDRQGNPPWGGEIQRNLDYLRVFAREMAYVASVGYVENGNEFKKRLIRGMRMMAENATGRPQMRITDKNPTIQWANVWTNIHHPALSDSIKSTWYVVVHEIVPTNERLAAKRITDTDRCTRCDRLDTLTHRIIACQEEEGIWTWNKGKIAQILRIDPRHIPADWALRPTLKVWRPQRHAAIIWILA
jgi:hypothetical protein